MMSLSLNNVLYSFAAVVLGLVLWQISRPKLPTFPGPPSLPLVGNLLHVPLKSPWLGFTAFGQQYGDVTYYHGLGNKILVLNSWDAIKDILIDRDSMYCSRPHLTVASELFDLVNSTAFAPYGDEWKLYRKFHKQALNSTMVRSYDPVINEVAAVLNKELLHIPKDFVESIRLASGRVIISAIYGLTIESANDPYIVIAEKAMSMISDASTPGAYLVDLIPALKYLPEWFPGTSFLQIGKEGRQTIADLTWNPLKRVESDIADGTAPQSFIRDILTGSAFEEDRANNDKYYDAVRWASASMYAAGQEVVACPVIDLFQAMALNPDKLRRAQAELDACLGNDRVPTLHDKASLPYIEAICKELLRWHPPVPLSIVKLAMEDDIYRDKLIPKGTLVMPNVWTISRLPDPEYDPESFAPERFLRADPPLNPTLYTFGFGRRRCPGAELAENFLFVMVASILSAFEISPAKDDQGVEIPINPRYSSGLVSRPEPFRCFMKARSANHTKLWEEQITPNYDHLDFASMKEKCI